MSRTRRRSAPVVVSLLAVLGALLPWPHVPVSLAAEYALETEASYDVRPAEGEIGVTVSVSFTNTTPDPDGQFSVFDEVKLAIHDDATAVTATEGDEDLEVEVAVENDVKVATVALGDELRFEETATFDLAYTLADSSDPQLRIRPSVVVFPAWGFGTSSQVRVSLPAGYEVRVDGDPLAEESGSLVSGPIEDPSRWLALITAIQPAEYSDFDATVPLAGGTADLRVRAFADDTAWGERTLALLSEALPLIEAEIGLPYPRIGQLIVTESVASDRTGFGEQAGAGTEIVISFDQPPFTTLHQAAHVWLTQALIESRWLREGLASHLAANVGERLEVALPFDPVERAAEASDAAFPLDAWSADAGPDGEAYGYAASWAFVAELEGAVGADALRQVLARAAASIGPYQSDDVAPDPQPEAVAAPEAPLTTRSFLDHLETVSGIDGTALFSERVLTQTDIALLSERAEARAGFAELVEAAGSWGAPDPVRGAMTDWQFADARTQMADAAAWLVDRDGLLEAMQAIGLSAPERLQQAYRSYGGGPEASAELEAERVVVDAYAATAADVNGERTFIERVGLIGGPDPAVELNLANGRFADGDLRGAVEAISEAGRIVTAAEAGGIVRIASAGLVAVLVLIAAALLVRRRSSYTAAP